MHRVDAVVVGAGVVGLAAARALAQAGLETVVLEAAGAIGCGVSSRSSEVIHAGLYYPPGSWKARLCVEGRARLYEFCQDRHIAHLRLGKLVVAAAPSQRARLEELAATARASGVDDCRIIDATALARLEPAVRGHAALLSPSTGIVDSHALMVALGADLEAAGGVVAFNAPFEAARATPGGFDIAVGGAAPARLRARRLVDAAGLDAQRVASAIAGLSPRSIPPRRLAAGRYYTYAAPNPFQRLIYPLPEEGGLGVHATPDLAGQLRFGPDVTWMDGVDHAFDDSRRPAFAAAIRAYFPGLDADRLSPGYVGVRPKLAGRGEPAADFRIDGPSEHGVAGLVALYGIESPGLTACLAIAERVRRLLTGSD